MKKTVFCSLILVFLMLTACTSKEVDPEQMITMSPEYETTAQETQPQELEAREAVYTFVFEDKILCPGESFRSDMLSAPVSTYEAPSCAGEGMDIVYNYGGFELTAYREAGQEKIYSVYFLNTDVSTPEGLALGDNTAKVQRLYGDTYHEEGTARIYTVQDTILMLIIQNDTVIGIEYRLKT